MKFERAIVTQLEKSLRSSAPLIQVVIGPRQVGKTTAAEQVVSRLGWPTVFESADAPLPHSADWIETHWNRARLLAKSKRVILIIDEIQKVKGWSEVVKRLWDQEKRTKGLVRPLLLGSSALLLQHGLTESLSGRFMLHRFPHWSADECSEAFGWNLEQWFYFGGYPGAAAFVKNENTWKRYILDSLIETVIARDVLQLQTVTKPALLRQLFALGATYPAQILSYNKMLGQLNDAGNTTTLAHYLNLLETAFLISGLELFSKGKPRKRGSSPKFVLWNNALINAPSLKSFRQVKADPTWRGRLVENAVGAKLLNELQGLPWTISYWRDGNHEVDYVVTSASAILGIEVKSGRSGKQTGMIAFKKAYPSAKTLLVGEGGVPLDEFFQRPASDWLE